MNIKHTTRDGQSMFISEMEDSHLSHTIRLILRKINEAKAILYNTRTDENKLKSAIYKIPKVKEEDVMSFIQKYTVMLSPYIMESTLRGISFTEELQSTFERTGKDTVTSQQFLLPDSVEDFEDYDYSNSQNF